LYCGLASRKHWWWCISGEVVRACSGVAEGLFTISAGGQAVGHHSESIEEALALHSEFIRNLILLCHGFCFGICRICFDRVDQ
jgi:hypothetical protein